jgi:1-acyl-sn-glycerol-3-phosphate acyltransferase
MAPRHRLEIGARVPRWGNAVLAGLGRAILRVLGWRLDIHLPDLPKFVIIGVPHTSNWDFVVGIAAIFVIRVRVRWWVKHTVYTWPWRHFVDWAGGIPINRTAAHGVVEQTVEAFAREPQFVLALAPEGTRSHVGQWKRGFHHVAVRARVPIVAAWFDYRSKVIGAGGLFHPTGDYAADTASILRFLRGRAVARHPHLYSGKA